MDGSAPRHFHQQILAGLTFTASIGIAPNTGSLQLSRVVERERMCVPSINNSLPRFRAAKWQQVRERRMHFFKYTARAFV